MDDSNLLNLQQIGHPENRTQPQLFLQQFGQRFTVREVPDPYYGGDAGFEQVLDLIEDACDGLLAAIEQRLQERSC